MNPRDAFLADTEFVKFKKSAGRICAEVITPYPPGIPVISPGEQITPEIVAYLDLEKKAGVRMQGPYDSGTSFEFAWYEKRRQTVSGLARLPKLNGFNRS